MDWEIDKQIKILNIKKHINGLRICKQKIYIDGLKICKQKLFVNGWMNFW